MKSTQRFFKLLELDRKDISYIYLYAIFAGIITLSLPLGIQAIINLMVGGEVSSSLYLLIGIITAGIAFNGFLTVMQLTVTETLQRRIFTRSAFEFAWRVPRLKIEALTGIYPPELVNRFFDTITIQKGIPKILIDFSTALLQIVFGLILLSLYHPFFVFFGLILLIILLSIFYFTGQRGLQTSLKESKYKYQVAHWLEELGRAMNIFKLSGVSKLPMRRTDELVTSYLSARKSHFKVLLVQYGSVVLFKTVITATLLLLGSILVIDNQISIGQFVAAEIIVILIMNSAEKLIVSMDNIYDVLTGLEKIGFVTDLPLEQTDGIALQKISDEDGGIEIEMDNVTFQYEDANVPTLKGVSLDIKSGEKVCIAGFNGSGKSTLTKLLGGLFTSYGGMITFNSIPLKNIDLDSLRKEIGTLSSQDEIFNASIIENITLGNDNISMETIIKTAKEIDLHQYINKLPDGYKTELIANGLNVPRSVRTKIILARTLIFQPCILLLDNFMPRLERREKQLIIDYLTEEQKHWTLIGISNNPNFAAKCDRVIVLEKGHIIADAPFDEAISNQLVCDIFRISPTTTSEKLLGGS
ncbi:MAG: ATP-binding cassette domain-containing protein [Bacteroidota bacterium]